VSADLRNYGGDGEPYDSYSSGLLTHDVGVGTTDSRSPTFLTASGWISILRAQSSPTFGSPLSPRRSQLHNPAPHSALSVVVGYRFGYRSRDLQSNCLTPGFYASGWHLNSSLTERSTRRNAFVPLDSEPLSEVGRHYVGGLLEHAVAASAFTTPTVNGYRRRRPYSLAPDRVTWGFDNRAAMVRVISSPGDETSHIENRVGEPAANPYLYMASQALSGLDGITNKTDPGPVSDDPYSAAAPQLPTSLADALDALDGDAFFRRSLGDRFVDYIVTMKRSETARYAAHLADRPDVEEYAANVTDWEHREYFELF
jgi:hypothetical protein